MDYKEQILAEIARWIDDHSNVVECSCMINSLAVKSRIKVILSTMPTDKEIARGQLHKYDHENKMSRRDYEVWDSIVKWLDKDDKQ